MLHIEQLAPPIDFGSDPVLFDHVWTPWLDKKLTCVCKTTEIFCI